MFSKRPRPVLDKSGLPQQVLMEKLVSMLSQKQKSVFQDEKQNFLPFKEWLGIEVNADEKIVGIRWYHVFDEDAQLDFTWLPPTLQTFQVESCCLVGSLSLHEFPETLIWLSLKDNRLSGEINLNELPHEIQFVGLSKNDFCGTLTMEKLPKSLKFLSLAKNKLSGPVNLRNLPGEIDIVDLSYNKFTTDILTASFHPLMEFVDFSVNSLDEKDLLENCLDPSAMIASYAGSKYLRTPNGYNIVKF